MKKLFILFSFLFLLSLIDAQCTRIKTPQGVIDLTPLAGKIQFASNIKDTNDFYYDYFFSVCDNMKIPCGDKSPSGVCQLWDDTNTANLGVYQKIKALPTGNGVFVSFDNGDPVGGVPRSVNMTITCDPNSEDVKLTALQNYPGTLTYIATGTSKYACPNK